MREKESSKAKALRIAAETITDQPYDYVLILDADNLISPLSLIHIFLYENARSTPSLQILEKEKLLQKKLLSKEKRIWPGFIQAGGRATYGIADNVANSTDVNTRLIYR